MNLPEDKTPVFVCIREWDAAMTNFKVPEGSKIKKCEPCGANVWVQKSCFKMLDRRKDKKHFIVCFQCMERLPKPPGDNEVHVIPEALSEYYKPNMQRRLKEIFGRNSNFKVWGEN